MELVVEAHGRLKRYASPKLSFVGTMAANHGLQRSSYLSYGPLFSGAVTPVEALLACKAPSIGLTKLACKAPQNHGVFFCGLDGWCSVAEAALLESQRQVSAQQSFVAREPRSCCDDN